MKRCDKCQAEVKPGGVILHKPTCPIIESQLYIDTGLRGSDINLDGDFKQFFEGYEREKFIKLGDRVNSPTIRFRAVCGAQGYSVFASFNDQEGIGGGGTPREAMKSLASSLRKLADQVEQLAKEAT